MSRAVGCVAPFCSLTVDVALQSTSHFNASTLVGMEAAQQLRLASPSSTPSHASAAFLQSAQAQQHDI